MILICLNTQNTFYNREETGGFEKIAATRGKMCDIFQYVIFYVFNFRLSICKMSAPRT